MNMRTINNYIVIFLSQNRRFSKNIQELIDADLLETKFLGTVFGYRYGLTSAGTTFALTAKPVDSRVGAKNFFSNQDFLVRYAVGTDAGPSSPAVN